MLLEDETDRVWYEAIKVADQYTDPIARAIVDTLKARRRRWLHLDGGVR